MWSYKVSGTKRLRIKTSDDIVRKKTHTQGLGPVRDDGTYFVFSFSLPTDDKSRHDVVTGLSGRQLDSEWHRDPNKRAFPRLIHIRDTFERTYLGRAARVSLVVRSRLVSAMFKHRALWCCLILACGSADSSQFSDRKDGKSATGTGRKLAGRLSNLGSWTV